MSIASAPSRQTRARIEVQAARPSAYYNSLPLLLPPSSAGAAAAAPSSSATMLKKRFTSLLRSKSTRDNTSSSSTTNNTATAVTPGSSSNNYANSPADSPETTCARAITAFCESGNASAGGEEVLHLPVIVDAAESSPAAAAAATHVIRSFLAKEYSKKPSVQYNAIMLVRILCDNPGASFTRNFDKPFVSAVKELLRNTKDLGTQQIMRETLDALEVNKQHDAHLQPLLAMWAKEKGNNASLSTYPRTAIYPAHPPADHQRSRSSRQLPNAVELASRVEEARNTAKILLQLVQSTPAADLLNNELIKEFGERCQSAQRSMQGYISCQDPAPDHDTMQTLIETNEQLSLAMSRYQRAVLAARRELGVPASPPPQQESTGYSAFAPTVAEQQQQMSLSQPGLITPPVNGWQAQAPPGPPPSHIATQPAAQSPFADPTEQRSLAIETGNISAFAQPTQSAFNIDSGAIHANRPYDQRDELENTYSDARTPVSQPSPILYHSSNNDAPAPVSPQSPPRPGPGPYHQSEISQSYVGRQSSAVNGLTMHGAGSGEDGNVTDRGRGY